MPTQPGAIIASPAIVLGCIWIGLLILHGTTGSGPRWWRMPRIGHRPEARRIAWLVGYVVVLGALSFPAQGGLVLLMYEIAPQMAEELWELWKQRHGDTNRKANEAMLGLVIAPVMAGILLLAWTVLWLAGWGILGWLKRLWKGETWALSPLWVGATFLLSAGVEGVDRGDEELALTGLLIGAGLVGASLWRMQRRWENAVCGAASIGLALIGLTREHVLAAVMEAGVIGIVCTWSLYASDANVRRRRGELRPTPHGKTDDGVS